MVSPFSIVAACDQVIVSGKLRAQRAKSMKFKDGYMISSGQPVKDYIDSAVRHVLLRQVGLQFVQFLLSLGCWNLTWEVYNWHTGCSWYQGEDYA